MDAMCEEIDALITENNALVSQTKEKYSHVITEQQEINLKLNGFLCLLDRLKVHERTQNKEEVTKEYLDLKLGVMCNILWLCWTYNRFYELYDSVLLTKIDENLKMVLLSSIGMLGEIKVWPDALNGRNTFIISYMELVLEKILSLPVIHAGKVLQLCILSVLYILKFDPGDDVLEKCINLVTTSWNISKKLSEKAHCSLGSDPKETKVIGTDDKKKLPISQFDFLQCAAHHQSFCTVISEALQVLRNLCCTKLKNRENAVAFLTLPVENMTYFHYINLYVRAFAFICQTELKQSSVQLWAITQLNLDDCQKAAVHILHGYYLQNSGFYSSAHKQYVKSVESAWMMIALQLLCSNYSFLITEIKDRIGSSPSGFLDCYIQLLKTSKSALRGSWISSAKHNVNFEFTVISYLYADPKFSVYSLQYDLARAYTKCQNYLSASEEYMSLLGSILTKDYNASGLSQKQDIFTNIRLIIHDAILVHMKSSQLETALLLCRLCTDQKSVPATRVESAEAFILGMKDDVIAMMLTAEVYMGMGKINEAKDILMRSMEAVVGCILNLTSSRDADCYKLKATELLNGLLAKVYLQIAECYLQNHLMIEASCFLQRSLEIKPGHPEAVMLYQNMQTGSVGHVSHPVSDSEESVNLLPEDCKSTALMYLLKGKHYLNFL
ncbi:uncharacterized protein LOC126185083 isoform X3 [Schistocerca cancellata]|uniref:uncharacterized protein LOC126185083 isoform X3 n=1 Tax=Schistocerca cancellata TaxID=274614 RepID=UPI002118FF91|nr:uncharacterized protein LOC126185083 isoform X3 [Schistocerca cancellata]